MDLTVGLPPGPDTVEYARLAEQLGYTRVWLFDSAALYEDIWITLALLAEHTTLDLGTAVLVPNLRHVMTTASAIATIERLAPGRLTCGFGTGATARWVLDKPALSWATTRRYVEQLRALLRGEVVDVDGSRCQMVHHERWGMPRPIDTPFLMSALGPKGLEITREMCDAGVVDGLISFGPSTESFPRQVAMIAGTVVDPGESLETPRVKLAIGPWYVLRYHGTWQLFPDGLAGLPLGDEWRAGIEKERAEGERHLAVHAGHVTDVAAHDQDVLDAAGDDLATAGWVGSAEDVAERARAFADGGVTELLYTPSGPDIAREMRAFAGAVLG